MTDTTPRRRYHRTPSAANHLGVRPRTMEKWRVIGGGPPFSKLGKAVVYDEADLDRKITCPLHVLWASDGAMGRMYDVLKIWKDRGTQVTGTALTGGHNLQEGNPSGVLAQLLPFLA